MLPPCLCAEQMIRPFADDGDGWVDHEEWAIPPVLRCWSGGYGRFGPAKGRIRYRLMAELCPFKPVFQHWWSHDSVIISPRMISKAWSEISHLFPQRLCIVCCAIFSVTRPNLSTWVASSSLVLASVEIGSISLIRTAFRSSYAIIIPFAWTTDDLLDETHSSIRDFLDEDGVWLL